MIISGLMKLLNALLAVLLVGLPDYEPPQSVGLSVLAAADFVLPLSELGLAFGALVAYATASLIWMGVMKVVNLVRGSG